MLRFWSRLPALVPMMISLLLGSAECGAQSATSETFGPLTLPANTAVQLRLKKSLDSKDAKPGQPVEFEVVYDVRVKGGVAILHGVAVNGSVRQVDQSGKGRAKLLIDLGTTQTISGETVRLTGSGTMASDKLAMKDVGGLAAAEPEFIPVLPVALAMVLFQNKNVLLHKGTRETAYVAEALVLDAAKLRAAQAQLRDTLRVTCRKGAEKRPNSVRTHVSVANCLGEAYDWDGAIQEYQQALALKPNSPELHFDIAALFWRENDFDHAIPECRSGVQLKPKDEHAREELVHIIEDSGDLGAALAELKEAIRIWPNKPYLHYLLGRLLVKKNEPDAAIVELQWALTKDKHLILANCELGRAFELKGDLDAALGQYRTAFQPRSLFPGAYISGSDQQCRAAYERLQLQLKK